MNEAQIEHVKKCLSEMEDHADYAEERILAMQRELDTTSRDYQSIMQKIEMGKKNLREIRRQGKLHFVKDL